MRRIDPDEPHRFAPLDLLAPPFVIPDARLRRRIADWNHMNGNRGIEPKVMPCTVCGGSMGLPVHFDSEWKPVHRRTT